MGQGLSNLKRPAAAIAAVLYLAVAIVVFIGILQLIVTPLPDLFVPRCLFKWLYVGGAAVYGLVSLACLAQEFSPKFRTQSAIGMLHYSAVIISAILLIIWGFVLNAGDPVAGIPQVCGSGEHAVYKFDNSINARWSLQLQAWHVAHLTWALVVAVTGFAVFMAPRT